MTLYITLIGFLLSWLVAPLLGPCKSVSYPEGLLASGLAVCFSFGVAIVTMCIGAAIAIAKGPSFFESLYMDYWPLPGMAIGFLWGLKFGLKLVRTESKSNLEQLRLAVYTLLILIAIALLLGGYIDAAFPEDSLGLPLSHPPTPRVAPATEHNGIDLKLKKTRGKLLMPRAASTERSQKFDPISPK